jgi:hypothetical protein
VSIYSFHRIKFKKPKDGSVQKQRDDTTASRHEKPHETSFLSVTFPSLDQEESSESLGPSLEMDPSYNPILTFKANALAVPELENMQIKLDVVLNTKNK